MQPPKHLNKPHEQAQKCQHKPTLSGRTLSPRGTGRGAERSFPSARRGHGGNLGGSRLGALLGRGERNGHGGVSAISSGGARPNRLRNVVHDNVGGIDGVEWLTSDGGRYRNHGCDGFFDGQDFRRSTALGDSGDWGLANENTVRDGGGDTESRWKITGGVTGKIDTIGLAKTKSVFVRILLILDVTAYGSTTLLAGAAEVKK